MNDVPIQIRNPEVVRAIRELAESAGQPITEAVGDAVAAALALRRADWQAAYKERLAAIREVSKQFRDLPRVGPVLTDDDFYDEEGMPK